MSILVACECSGRVRDALIARGYDAMSCDLEPSEMPGPHYQGDVMDILNEGWTGMIAHPPCTYLSRAGARWWKQPGRAEKADAAARFAFALRDANIPCIAIENPIGQLNRRWRHPDQTIQPYQFGHPYSKATCLWLKGLPLLCPTNILAEFTPLLPSNTGKGRRAGERSHPGHISNAKDASRTFQGIADAIASQWGALLANIHP